MIGILLPEPLNKLTKLIRFNSLTLWRGLACQDACLGRLSKLSRRWSVPRDSQLTHTCSGFWMGLRLSGKPATSFDDSCIVSHDDCTEHSRLRIWVVWQPVDGSLCLTHNPRFSKGSPHLRRPPSHLQESYDCQRLIACLTEAWIGLTKDCLAKL